MRYNCTNADPHSSSALVNNGGLGHKRRIDRGDSDEPGQTPIHMLRAQATGDLSRTNCWSRGRASAPGSCLASFHGTLYPWVRDPELMQPGQSFSNLPWSGVRATLEDSWYHHLLGSYHVGQLDVCLQALTSSAVHLVTPVASGSRPVPVSRPSDPQIMVIAGASWRTHWRANRRYCGCHRHDDESILSHGVLPAGVPGLPQVDHEPATIHQRGNNFKSRC